eukprot:9442063-Heterocapsa_arctica.AAC.1
MIDSLKTIGMLRPAIRCRETRSRVWAPMAPAAAQAAYGRPSLPGAECLALWAAFMKSSVEGGETDEKSHLTAC